MGVKWTPELLLKILETSEVRVDSKAIAEKWPKEKEFSPTPRAIQERLVKIRQMAQAQFSISSHNAKTNGKGAPPATPRARGPQAKGSSATPTKAANAARGGKSASNVTPSKRKRGIIASDDSGSLSSFKEEGNGSDTLDDMPAKRNKAAVKEEQDADELDSGNANGFETAVENGGGFQEGMWANEV
ncbi:MAG: hypothetical protein Q9167_006975 [Letrouitia subvulpina]